MLAVLFAAGSIYYSEASYFWAGLLMLAFGILCLYFGVGSLRGQHRDVVTGYRAPPAARR